MPFTIRARQTQTFKIPGGSASAPSLTFANATTSGLFHSGGQGNVGVSVNGIERLTIHANGISVNGTVTANSLVIANASTVEYAPFSMANVQITDSTWTVLDDTAVSTDGGFIVINGNGFWGGTVVTVDSTPAIASSALSYTKIGAQVPAKAAGTYAVSVIRPDALSVTLPTGLTYSPFPVWSTSSTLANVTKYTAFTQTLAATEASSSNITYTVANGSSLPANVTLSSGGVLSGNILTDPGNTTTYSFSITATDAQFQNNIPRTFGMTAKWAVQAILDTLLVDNVTQGGNWYAVKYMYDATNTPAISSAHTTTNYYLNQTILKTLVAVSTDMLFREDSSDTLAVFASTSAFNTVKTNILNGGSWFYNTHGNNTLSGWLVGINGKNIPDAQQNGCSSYGGTVAWETVFDSCSNGNGSHAALNSINRLRGGLLYVGKVHSIWFKISS